MERWVHRQIYKRTERQKDRLTDSGQMNIQTLERTDTWRNIQIEILTDTNTEKETDIQTDGGLVKQADR